MEGVQILTKEGVHAKLGELARDAELPWALIQSQVLAFADKLREHGVFFVFSDDVQTINKLQPELIAGRDCYFGLPGGQLFVHSIDMAKRIIEAYGQAELGIMWGMAKPHLLKYLDVLYSHNCFVARGDDAGAKLLREKTQEKTVCVRMKG